MRTKLAICMLWAALAVAGCAGGRVAAPDDGTVGADIVGGTVDKGDPAVVMLEMNQPGKGQVCTAEIVSPHVLITAAHCVEPHALAEDFGNSNPVQFSVFTGYDEHNAKPDQFLAVQNVFWDSQFNVDDLQAGHDFGIVILAQPTTIPPLPFNHLPLGDGVIGQPVRQIGYGYTSATNPSSVGIKRTTNTRLTVFDAAQEYFASNQHSQCHGDSGGPTLFKVNGVEQIIGLSSWGPGGNCKLGSWDSRVDLFAKIIDFVIQKYDGMGPAAPPPATGMCPTGNVSTSIQGQSGQCQPTAGQPAGGACASSDDCASVCCSCSHNSAYAVRACANGKCLGQADACACFAQSNICQ